ncbi:MAG: L-aspartate oxidase [Cytophagales bacterium]|nr:L-aspartate oxidase [Cytophagales bacterium]
MKTDVLVIGSGISGLFFALKVALHFPDLKVTIITKADESESNTKYAQGGVAVVTDFKMDSYQKHISDTLKAGDGLCDREIVEMVIKKGPDRLKEIIQWGARFDKNNSGELDLGKEGGHSASRIVHHKDITGLELEQTLLNLVHQTPQIKLLTWHFAIDLITQHHLGKNINRSSTPTACYGAYVMNLKTSVIDKILSRITLLASGGAGQIYRNTTNSLIATGDGIAMAYRTKGVIENMEFIQFHPTVLYCPSENPSFLISEAVRGAGAILKTKKGKQFMEKYDERGSLASRDIVARAVDYEMKTLGHEYVFLDCRHIDKNKLKNHFPNIYKKCKSMGIDMNKDMLPVVPAAHYICGGIKTDAHGRTSIKYLYACGECASTGLHGANRLASNSLLEALVFAQHCYLDTIKTIKKISIKTNIPDWNTQGTVTPKEQVLITHNCEELRNIMSNYVGIVRSSERLQRAMKRIDLIYNETKSLYDTNILSPQLCELRNMVTIAYLCIQQSLQRKENKGVFFNKDI